MKMIIDFIKSWLYYSKLKQWLAERNFDGFPDNRFQYAYKHCRMKPVEKVEKEEKDFISEYKSVYDK